MSADEEEKNPVEKAMEKDCIILVAVETIVQAIRPTPHMENYAPTPDVKCRGPGCAQYNQFANVCGLR